MLELGDPCQIVSALIKQLCRKKDTIPSDLLRFKHNSLRPSFTSMQDLFISLATSFNEVFLIIDALDECPVDKRHYIIGFLTQVVKLLSHAKVFVTSRKELDIACAFKREKTPIIKIEAENVTADIRLYVTSEVKRLRHGYNGKRLYIESDALEEKIIRTLSEKAEGM
jgi:ankyrin repeat domain-containing protein 50